MQETEDNISSPGADDYFKEQENIPEIEVPGSPANSREQKSTQTPSPISPDTFEGTSWTDFGPELFNQQPAENEVILTNPSEEF